MGLVAFQNSTAWSLGLVVHRRCKVNLDKRCRMEIRLCKQLLVLRAVAHLR